jgi:hypothetical protein
MNKPRDPKGRYVKTNLKLPTKVPSNLFGGRNTPSINSAEWCRKVQVGDSSTKKDKNVLEETKTEETIEHKIKTPTIEGHEVKPLEPFNFSSSKPTNTTFAFLPPSGDSNFTDIIDPEQVNSLFGGSTNIVVSQVETTTSEPIISIGSRKIPEIQITEIFSYWRNISLEKERWDALLSPRIKPLRYSLFGNQISMDDHEDHNHVRNDEGEEVGNQTETTFWFPNLDTMPNVNMKNIPLSSLPTFYGKSSEDPYTFLFEFDILCRSYNYLQDAQKLKLFPTTLKDSALSWFMGLRESSIRSWEDMKTKFLSKY